MKANIHLAPQVGRVLVAEPFLLDNYYKRAVILIGNYDDENGTIGFIVNKPTDLSINDALIDFPEFDAPVYFGGPKKTEEIHYMHTLGNKIEGAKKIAPGIFWGGNLEILKLMIETKQVQQHQVRFFAGFSGWKRADLDREIKNNQWLIPDTKLQIKDLTFAMDPENIWGRVLKSVDCEYATLANFPEDPSPN